MKYTFQIRWPWSSIWSTSGRSSSDMAEAAQWMAEFLVISFDNGVAVEGRLHAVKAS